MKLLLDENLPHVLRHDITGHDCMTVAFMGWGGLKNGALLNQAARAGIDAMITKDAGLQYEQNLTDLPIAVIILHATTNDIDDIRPLVPALLNTLTAVIPRRIHHVR